jgi:hypothetical protein
MNTNCSTYEQYVNSVVDKAMGIINTSVNTHDM